MIATKFLNDSGEEDDILNSEWASSVGLSLPEVNRLEREFLAAIVSCSYFIWFFSETAFVLYI